MGLLSSALLSRATCHSVHNSPAIIDFLSGKSKHSALVPCPFTGIPVNLHAILHQFLCPGRPKADVFIDLCC